MKIIHILANLKGGGIQNLLLSLTPMQSKMGNEVKIKLIDYDDLDYSLNMKLKLEARGIKVISLNRKVHSKLSTIKAIIK